jgi:hypothetical protein
MSTMTQLTDPTSAQMLSDPDLAAEVQRVLEGSSEPLTLSKIRSSLPARLRTVSLEALGEVLRRQVAANVLVQYPKYRSQQDRFWDRPMTVHVAHLLRQTLEESPLAWSELRRKLPDYAKSQAESVLEDQVSQGLLHRHPPTNSRSGQRYGIQRPDARDYLRGELTGVFSRLEKLGFSLVQLREGALELLHEEEWATTLERTPQQAQIPSPAAEPRPQEGASPTQDRPVAAQTPPAPKAAQGSEPHSPLFREPQTTNVPETEGKSPAATPGGQPL